MDGSAVGSSSGTGSSSSLSSGLSGDAGLSSDVGLSSGSGGSISGAAEPTTGESLSNSATTADRLQSTPSLLDRLSSAGDSVSDAAGDVWDGAADVAQDAGNFISQANNDYALVERGLGALTVAGGAAEIALGTVGILAPEPITTAAGLVGAAHGIDTTLAGLEQIRTGQFQQTVTEQLVSSGAQNLGASDDTADNIGLGVDISVSLLNPANLARHAVQDTIEIGAREGAERTLREGAGEVALDTASVTSKSAIGPASGIEGKLAAESGAVSRESTLRALRQNGSPEALATASLIKRNKVNLNFLQSDPAGAAGRQPFFTKDVNLFLDKISSPGQAAGFAAHETKHVLQQLTPSKYTSNAHQFELEAYQWQRKVDLKFPLNTDSAVTEFLSNSALYPTIK